MKQIADFARIVFFAAAIAMTAGCDQLPQGNRYEISKDQAGRTLRLDKRTGEIAVLDGDRIVPMRDAKDAEVTRKTEEESLASAKSWPKVPLQQFGIDALLQTSWQDGSLLYSLRFVPLRKVPSAASKDKDGWEEVKDDTKGKGADATIFDDSRLRGLTFTLILEDSPFELASNQVAFNTVVDNDGKPTRREAKGKIAMTRDVYRRIDSWNVSWR